ncbi:MAG: Rieske 2Fe-2S domain-containing protein [Burkholderiaceae bacterium]|nr:Rieske 2Fe-2S domain-containing protein [Burkholderiaceae bacterium]
MTRAPDWRSHPGAPLRGTRVCALADLPPDNGREVVFGAADYPLRIAVFRFGDTARAYVNRCPHFGIPFECAPGVFSVHDAPGGGRQVLCPHHAALFDLDDGRCVDGPGLGSRLCAVPLEVVDGVIRIA